MSSITKEQADNISKHGDLVAGVDYSESYSHCYCRQCDFKIQRGTKESIAITVIDSNGDIIDSEGTFGPYCIDCLNKMRFLISQVDK